MKGVKIPERSKDMGTEVRYEHVIEQAKGLAVKDQLRLISDLSAVLSQQLQVKNQEQKTSADFYGIMRGVKYDEADFESAEWHPTGGELLGN
jgi:hypothetical protein